MNDIKVTVVKFSGRTNLLLRYVDPLTGKRKHKSAGATTKREAERAAAIWEAELQQGIVDCRKVTWAQFRERYETDVLATLATATESKVCGIFDSLEKHISPVWLRDVDANRLSTLQSKLRESGLSQTTIKTHLTHIMAALRWAVKIGWLAKAPAVTMPARAKGTAMKGRPIAGEEFDRMLAAVPKVVGDEAAPSWQHYLRGLWLSGLRLAESLQLCWDRDDRLCVDMQPGEHPMLKIPAELEKGNQDRLLPMAPEFAEFLQQTPVDQRTGFVFNPKANRVHGPRLGVYRVCELLSAIGEKAGIKVKADAATGKVKFASAHDLRRSFGLRWASRVMPQVLMELMRHQDIETTLKYYVGRNAQNTADVLWKAHQAATAGNTSGNTATNGGKTETAKTP